ncbi:MAG: hypothetical protein HYV09_03480 [Deltaproteobacteria bacterium]|nr:hypothetical protein [Deltaproteobacteria bacterium]
MGETKVEGTIAGARPLTILQAAKLLGLPGSDGAAERRLRRYILRRERLTNETILVRRGSEKSPRYLVTIPVLRQHCAELFDTRAETEERLREQFEEIEDKLHELERRDEALARAILAGKPTVAAGTKR